MKKATSLLLFLFTITFVSAQTALQEVVAGPGGSQAVAQLADLLNRKGIKWDYRISNPTNSPKYKKEKYAFLWKVSKAQIIDRPTLVKEVAAKVFREPYRATFKIEGQKITILNYHSRRFDEHPEIEVAALAEYLKKQNTDKWLIAGDFNLSADAMAFNAFKVQGFDPLLEKQKTTLKRKCAIENGYLYHDIDNIFLNRKHFVILDCGIIDFVNGCENLTAARFISDHVPIFVELKWNDKN
jgi:endonuclease/exonuclease/phosphatase family metal-dependent hydrolase